MLILPKELESFCHHVIFLQEKQNIIPMKVGWVSYLQFSHADSGLISSLCFCLEFPSLPTPPHQPGNSGHWFNCSALHLSVPRHPPPATTPSKPEVSQEQKQNFILTLCPAGLLLAKGVE